LRGHPTGYQGSTRSLPCNPASAWISCRLLEVLGQPTRRLLRRRAFPCPREVWLGADVAGQRRFRSSGEGGPGTEPDAQFMEIHCWPIWFMETGRAE
jgi:hypothetical protein